MTKKLEILLLAGLLAAIGPAAHGKQRHGAIEPLPRELEIQLALSALPPHLREEATVYVLNVDEGFEVAREGSNGLHAFVGRNDPGLARGSWAYTEYRNDILVPIAFDSAGAEANMRPHFDTAELQASGTPPAELRRTLQERFENGYYKAPKRPGISYMLSPVLRPYLFPERSGDVMVVNRPHYMFYAPHVSNEDIGGGRPMGPQPFLINPGPHGYIIKAVGEAERAEINREHADLLERLCALRTEYCLPKQEASSR